ncbi:SCO7613 C-terminal domain-containing membrane protein [Nocardioides sp. CFH 31398]|uniref:SCO7613 C-terminal domain-containing membrane protein n=1 Tax=Nocardioides sp. CFH 31398 TaxID=2919579 RepID=UPI001F061969|nr:hypothetical protein [Nocardioides sp. CFH 31398]MCH1867897.1 hypothetical protein [Nocardioides sp. CFH 31398]
MTSTQAPPPDAALAELRDIDRQLDRLFARRAFLVSTLPPLPQAPPLTGAPAPAAHGAPGASVQQLLLTTGAVLLGLAGLFFAAVAWALVGPVGRTGILVVLGVVLGVAAVGLRHRLAGAAGALASVSAALVAIAAYGGPVLWQVDWSGVGLGVWTTAVSVVLLLVWTGLAVGSAMRSWTVSATLAAVVGTVAAGLTVADLADDVLGLTATTAVVVLVVVALRRVVREPAAWWVVLAVAASTSLLSLLGWVVEPERTVPYAVAGLAWAGLALLAPRLAPDAVGPVVAHAAAAALTAGSVALLVGSRGWGLPWGGPSLPVVALGAALVVLVALVRVVPALPTAVAAGTLGLGAVAVPTVAGLRWTADGWVVALVVVTLALAVAGAAPRLGRDATGRGALWAAAGVAACLARGVHLVEAGTLEPVERVALGLGLLLVVAGTGWALSVRRYAGTWLTTAAWLLPGLLVGLVPGALVALAVTWDDGWSAPLVRSLAYTVVGALLLAAGARTRTSALVVAGEVLLVVCALAHLGAAAREVPQWVVLAAAGALLLAVGARWEQLRGRGSAAVGWVGSLR